MQNEEQIAAAKKNDSGLSTEKGESFEKVAVGESMEKVILLRVFIISVFFMKSFLNQRISPQCGEI